MLSIESAEYTLLDGTPALRLGIDGKAAFICQANPALLEAGYVYLISLTPGFSWEDELPVPILPAVPGVLNAPAPLAGMTDDAGVLRLAREFYASLAGEGERSFALGPVSL
ncbi:MAG: hypothetical protein LBQ63_02600 [Deltaproteobacteria bacterium]|jgi:hypothetical protein|nr:hypothetical protein [Deltaproteobacteria bacterium]